MAEGFRFRVHSVWEFQSRPDTVTAHGSIEAGFIRYGEEVAIESDAEQRPWKVIGVEMYKRIDEDRSPPDPRPDRYSALGLMLQREIGTLIGQGSVLIGIGDL